MRLRPGVATQKFQLRERDAHTGRLRRTSRRKAVECGSLLLTENRVPHLPGTSLGRPGCRSTQMRPDLRHVRFHGMPAMRAVPLPASGRGGVRLTPRAVPHPAAGAPLDDLARDVLTCADLDPDTYRAAPLGRRVAACMRALSASSRADARAALSRDPGLGTTVLGTLLIGVSSFFRDPPVFETVRARILPEMTSRLAPIRVLSVGCSTGAEVYSMAMLLAEAGLLARTRLLGIDCRHEALAQARVGIFDDHGLSGLDAARREAFLEPVVGGWRVVGALRRQCDWAAADATRSVPTGPWDIVLCRNLAIYLEWFAGAALFTRIAEVVRPGGFLIVGKAERPPASLKLEPGGRCIYRRHEHG
jgi:chemotaxis protein methyltransferase CheR